MRDLIALDIVRFIPARAGNTRVVALLLAGNYGSSPHARGTHLVRRYDDRKWRFIPARAGNTGLSVSLVGPGAVHPRTRGEHRGVAVKP